MADTRSGVESRQGRTAIHPRWFRFEGDECAREACAVHDGLESDQAPRKARYLALTSLYEMRRLDGLHATAYEAAEQPYEEVYIPIARSLCDTVQSDIAGRQRVKAMFSTTGADWRTRRRAKKLDRFVEAVMHQQQGTYCNGWELCDDAFMDEAICGSGVTRSYVDDTLGKPQVILERMRPGTLKVDPREAANGDPQNYFWDELADEDHLLAVYVDAPDLQVREPIKDEAGEVTGYTWRAITDAERDTRRFAIEAAAAHDQSLSLEQYGSTRIARSVKLRHAVRLPISRDQPGRYVIAVPQAILYDDEYTRREPPAVVWRWSRERWGFWGVGLVEETRTIVAEFNTGLQRMSERVALCSGKRTYIRKGSVEKADMEANDAEVIIEVEPGMEYPQETEVPPFAAQEFQYLQWQRQLAHESPGVGMQGATSRKDPGITAAVAIREIRDIGTQRFAVRARYGYEYPFVAMARQIVLACAEYVEATGNDIEVALPSSRGATSIKWSQAKLDIESLVVQLAPASALPNDPAGRQQAVAEGFAQGLMSPTTYKRLSAWPDLAAEVDRENAEYEYVEALIDRYLDADEESWTSSEYETPDGYILGKEAAMVQFAQAYFIAKRERAPEFNLELLRRYMMQTGELIERAQQPPPDAMPADQLGAASGAPVSPSAGLGVAPSTPEGMAA